MEPTYTKPLSPELWGFDTPTQPEHFDRIKAAVAFCENRAGEDPKLAEKLKEKLISLNLDHSPESKELSDTIKNLFLVRLSKDELYTVLEKMSVGELVKAQTVNSEVRDMAKQILAGRFNRGEITFDSLKIKTKANKIAFCKSLEPYITHLDLSGFTQKDSEQFTTEEVRNLLSSNQYKTINLTGLRKITDKALTNLSAVESIILDHTPVTNEAVKALKEAKNLHTLGLNGIAEIDDEALKSLGAHNTKLVSLGLYNCKKITDEGIKALEACKSLRMLTMEKCIGITDESIEQIVNNHPRIEVLYLMECDDVTEKGIEKLLKLNHLKSLTASHVDGNLVKELKKKVETLLVM